MKAEFYLPYYSAFEDGSFDVNSDFYKTNADYFNAMADSVAKTENGIMNGMMNYERGGTLNDFRGTDGQTYAFRGNQQGKADKVDYAKCDGVLLNAEDNTDCIVDKFIEDFVSKDVHLYTINLDLDSSDEDFEQELNLWNRDHENIQKYSETKGNDWILDNEPMRNIRMKFKNKANDIVTADLVNCKIMEKHGITAYVILVEEINLIDNNVQ